MDHGVCSLPLEEMGDASPWAQSTMCCELCLGPWVRTQNVSPRKYKSSDPLKRGVNPKYTGKFNRSGLCAYNVKQSIAGRRIIEPRGRTFAAAAIGGAGV